MKKVQVLQAWGRILTGQFPSLSIEITKECPLRCPGCYAFDAAHLGGETKLRQLSDYRGDELVQRILALVDEHKPLHLSLVGGDPLVRYRELEILLPQLEARGIHTQIVTSAFRVIPPDWAKFKSVYVVVSIDGLQPEHDERRKPATYERILKNISQSRVTIHSTITSNFASRPGYLEEFVRFWSDRPEIARIWFSLFTPQRGATDPEILTPAQRIFVMEELLRLRRLYPILEMPEELIREIATPPKNPKECIFAQTTHTLSADLKTKITPCQFGGDPDCEQCGCIASMGLAVVGRHPVVGSLTAGRIFMASAKVGKGWKRAQQALSFRRPVPPGEGEPFTILPS
jgi:MoaA/NifB/PqqE/SkfB family radical SAM enzyme